MPYASTKFVAVEARVVQDRLMLSCVDMTKLAVHNKLRPRSGNAPGDGTRSRFPFQQGVAMATMPENQLDGLQDELRSER